VIKALFFDLDGTLLNSSKKISPITLQALEKCHKEGIKLYIATARPPLLSKMLSWDDSLLSLFDGGAYYNGGCVVLGNEKTYTAISDDIVQTAIGYALQYDDLNISLQLEDDKHAFRFPLKPSSYQAWGMCADEALTQAQEAGLRTVKLVVFYSDLIDSTTPLDDKLVQNLEKLCEGKAQFYLTDKGQLVQIMTKGVNKLSGIEKIRTALGFEKDEIAVFGDDVNDIEMLSAYENSIAMGNAEDYVKDVARHVTLDNDNDGISHAIYNILCLL